MASSSTTLEKLIAQINASPVYQRMTSEQIAAEANRRYQSEYDQKRQSARQAYETSDAALSRQIAALSAAYNKQRLQSEQQNRQTYAQADRQALGRGMQRSSYNNANLTNIAMAGDAALRAITQANTVE